MPKLFRNKRFYCQTKKLVDRVRMDKGSGRFTPFINNLLKGKKTIPKNDKDLIKTCRFARIGTGRVLVDARPFEERPIPADLMMFWTKPAPGAVAAFEIVGIPDETVPGREGEPDRARDRAGRSSANFFSEKTPDGLFDYKLVLPTGPINGIRISVAEVKVTTTGLTYTKKTKKCTKKRRGKCVKRKTTTEAHLLVHPASLPGQRQAELRGLLRLRHGARPAEAVGHSVPGLQALVGREAR